MWSRKKEIKVVERSKEQLDSKTRAMEKDGKSQETEGESNEDGERGTGS